MDRPEDMPAQANGGSLPAGPARIRVRAGFLARNTFFNLLGYAIPIIIGLATLPFIIRGLGTERFGILSLVWIVLGYFGFLDLGLGRATIRFAADAIGRGAPGEIPQYLWTTTLIQLVLSLVGTLLLLLGTPFLVGRILHIAPAYAAETRTAFVLMAASLPLVMISASFRGVLEAAQRFDLVNAVKIPASSANYLVPLLSLFFWKSLVGIVVLLLVFRTLTLGVWVGLAFRLVPDLKRGIVFRRDKIRPLLSFGGWATLSSLIGSLLENLDRFAIGAFLSMTAVAYYSAPYEAVGRMGILPASLVTALFPAFSLLKGGLEENAIRDLFARAVKYILAAVGMIVVPIIILARPLLTVWLGAEFSRKSGLVLQLLAASFLFLSFTYVAFNLLQAVGRTDLPAKIYGFLLVIYAPLLWAGIKLRGIEGAAAAWLIHLALQAVFLYFAVKKLGYTDLRSMARDGTGRILVALAGFAVLGLGLNRLMLAPAAAVLSTAAYLAVVWGWVLNPEEKAWLRRAAGRLRRRGREDVRESRNRP